MSAELVSCPQCARKNNALRPSCIYCGAALPVVEELSPEAKARMAQPKERNQNVEHDPLSHISSQLQQSLLSFNIILLPIKEEQRAKAIEVLTMRGGYSDSEAQQLLKFSRPMPIVRYQHEAEAKAVFEQLQNEQLPIIIVSDEKLQLQNAPRRTRRLNINVENGMQLVVSPEVLTEAPQMLSGSDIQLIVEGKVRYRQSEATEENKGFGKTERELTNAVEYADEQSMLDVYTSSLDTSFRVRADAFDYSGLGTKMKLTTIENFRMLISVLRELAPKAVFDTEFKQCSKLLEQVWPSIQRNESLGLRRSKILSAGKISTRSVYHTDNEMQFNRYSRLRFCLLEQLRD